MAQAATKAIAASTARFMSSWMRAASPSTYMDFCFAIGAGGVPLLLRCGKGGAKGARGGREGGVLLWWVVVVVGFGVGRVPYIRDFCLEGRKSMKSPTKFLK